MIGAQTNDEQRPLPMPEMSAQHFLQIGPDECRVDVLHDDLLPFLRGGEGLESEAWGGSVEIKVGVQRSMCYVDDLVGGVLFAG